MINDYDNMNKKELTALGRKYTKTQKKRLTGVALKFAKWVYIRRMKGSIKGVKFSVDKVGNHNCFHADGEPFSFTKAVKNQDYDGQHKSNVLEAFRSAIDEQVSPLREKGKHVDHIIPFHVILSDFMLDRKIGFKDIEYYDGAVFPAGFVKKQLADDDLRLDFEKYHRKVARLRVIPISENLRKGATEDLAIYRYRLNRGETYDKY